MDRPPRSGVGSESHERTRPLSSKPVERRVDRTERDLLRARELLDGGVNRDAVGVAPTAEHRPSSRAARIDRLKAGFVISSTS